MASNVETISTERLLLRGIDESDTAEIVKWRSNPEAYKYFKDPHEITHTVDAVRGFCVSRIIPTEAPETKKKRTYEDLLEDKEENYESFMCGGEPGPDYLGAA